MNPLVRAHVGEVDDYAGRIGLATVLLLGVAGLVDLAIAPVAAVESAAVTAVTAVVVAVLTTVAVRTGPGPHRAHLGGAGTVALALDAVVHVRLQEDPFLTFFVLLVVFGSGTLLRSWRWLLAVEVVCVLGVALAAALSTAGGTGDAHDIVAMGWRSAFVAVVFASFIAHLQLSTRTAWQRRAEALADRLAQQAQVDQLTGLLNRHGLAVEAERLAGPEVVLGVVVLDVDGFKQVNDGLGHAGGDDVLRQVAAGLSRLTASGDVVARTGGDEFVVLTADVEGCALDGLLSRIRQDLAGRAGDLGLPWSVSAGAASGPARSAQDVEDLVIDADAGMYAHKTGRRPAVPAPRPPAPAGPSAQRQTDTSPTQRV